MGIPFFASSGNYFSFIWEKIITLNFYSLLSRIKTLEMEKGFRRTIRMSLLYQEKQLLS